MTATFAARSVDMRVEWDKRQRALAAPGILGEIIAIGFLHAISLLSSWKRGANDRRVHDGCRRVDMLSLPLEEYNAHADAVHEGFVTASRLLGRERIFDTRYLPDKSQLIPFAAIAAALGPRVDEPTAREKLLRWYWCDVFGELYGGTTETRFGKDISEVLIWIDGGPSPPPCATATSPRRGSPPSRCDSAPPTRASWRCCYSAAPATCCRATRSSGQPSSPRRSTSTTPSPTRGSLGRWRSSRRRSRSRSSTRRRGRRAPGSASGRSTLRCTSRALSAAA